MMAEEAPLGRIDYADVVDAETMRPVAEVAGASVFAVAVFFGKARLIDNVELDPGREEGGDERS